MTKDLTNNTQQPSLDLLLTPESPQRLASLCGRLNEHIHQIEKRLQVKILSRGHRFVITAQTATEGTATILEQSASILRELYQQTASEPDLSPEKVHLVIQESSDLSWLGKSTQQSKNSGKNTHSKGSGMDAEESYDSVIQVLKTPKCSIKPRSNHQNEYVRSVIKHDINFGIGPAGTGKTYLAVACAVEALVSDQVSRILLVRPAVEAGEKLGFLPGDLAQKVDPYLRPLYDALYEMLGFEKVAKLIERNIIEIAPLAYMRGRTLNEAFIILDGSQNTTASQMKMFLTRIGYGSTAVITGDITQIDLPQGTRSGLVHVSNILDGVEGISFTYFDSKDVVRHPIVQKIVEAYEDHDKHSISTLNTKDKDRINERDS